MEFIDLISNEITKLQSDIRNEVYQVKLSYKKLDIVRKEMEYQKTVRTGEPSNFECFLDNFNNIVSMMFDISQCMYQPPPVINVNKLKDLKEMALSKSNTATRIKSGRKPNSAHGLNSAHRPNSKKEKPPECAKTDFTPFLFEVEPVEHECFMSRICCNIYKSFQSIQQKACRFYNRHKKVSNKDRLQPTYEEFMKEVYEKYNYYHLQCELLWLEQVNEFLNDIEFLRDFFDNYRKDFIEQQYEFEARRFNSDHEEVLAQINIIKAHDKRLLQQIHDKLKPLHGHPKNSHLLNEIIQEMSEAVQQIRNFNLKNLLNAYKAMQDRHVVAYCNRLNEVYEKLKIVEYESCCKILDCPLIQQFEEKVQHMISLLETILQDSVSEEPDSIYHERIKAINIPSEYDFNLQKTKSLQEEFLNPTETNSETNIFQETQTSEYLMKLSEIQDRCILEVDNIEITWNVDADTFEKIFESAVQQIIKLYSVKYDNVKH